MLALYEQDQFCDRIIRPYPCYDIFDSYICNKSSDPHGEQRRYACSPRPLRDEQYQRKNDPEYSSVPQMGDRRPESVHPVLSDIFLDKEQDTLINLLNYFKHDSVFSPLFCLLRETYL